MAHHASTPATVLDAPVLRPLTVPVSHEMRDVVHGDHTHRKLGPVPLTGHVQEQFLGQDVHYSRKGRKIRRTPKGQR